MAGDSRPKPFRDIVLDQPGFLVHPLQWTSRHLEQLGWRFEDVPTTPVYPETPNVHSNGDSGKPLPKRPNDAEALAMDLFPVRKRHCLSNILLGEGRKFAYTRYDPWSTWRDHSMGMTERSLTTPLRSEGALFYFRGRPVHRPDYIVFHRHGGSFGNSPPALVGHVHYTSVNGDRRRLFEPGPGQVRTITSVGVSIRRKQLAQATPKQWTEDPYFLCHLLALAQLQERRLDSPKPSIFTVCPWPPQRMSDCRTSVDSLPVASPRDERIRSGMHFLIRGWNYHRTAEGAQESEKCNNARAVYNSPEKNPVQALRFLRRSTRRRSSDTRFLKCA